MYVCLRCQRLDILPHMESCVCVAMVLNVFGTFIDNVMHCLSVCFSFVIERPPVVHWGG